MSFEVDESMTECRACTEGGEARTTTAPAHSRRALLGAAALGVLGVGTACGDESAKDNKPAQPVTIAKADVPAVNAQPYTSDAGDFYLVHNKDGVLAFSWKCTHQGCKVPWKESEDCFHCPCHGSKFDYNGARFAGPAKRPLDLVKASVQPNGDVVVTADEKTKRSDYEPSQVSPYPARKRAERTSARDLHS